MTIHPHIFAYLAGPITPTEGRALQQNIDSAVAAFLRLSAAGIPAYCPQLTAAFPQAFDVPYEQWMALDFAILDRCTHLVLLEGWESSKGAQRERWHAMERGIGIGTVDGLIARAELLARARGSAQPCGCDPGCNWFCAEHEADSLEPGLRR